MTKFKKTDALKIALFFTGISGIVSEFILSTLASYFLGDSIIQWTMILSIMLFSMGVGSRISKYISTNVLVKLIYIELGLSVLVSFAPVFIYWIAGYTNFDGPIIYFFSIVVGMLIGLEIPLAIRINESYEELKTNVSSIMEKDYLGSLVGGAFFAFVGLPYLGVVNTSLLLGVLNFIVALVLIYFLKDCISAKSKSVIYGFSIGIVALYLLGSVFVNDIIMYGEQNKYKDKIVLEEQSKYQKIVITQYKEHFWLFINGHLQMSTYDEYLYHEPMVHPIMNLSAVKSKILVIGGGDGFTTNEILKHPEVESVTLVDLDKKMTDVGATFTSLTRYNKKALLNPKVNVINDDGFNYLNNSEEYFDIILIDLVDAKNIDINKLYTKEFYQICYRKLRPYGNIITQAGNPLLAPKAFLCVDKTIQSAGFGTVKFQNDVATMGKRGWVIGSKQFSSETITRKLNNVDFSTLETKWINNSAMKHMLNFGKINIDTSEVKANTLNNPVLYHYFLNGDWDMK